ncbi:MAG: hypothetical protein AAF489_13495 [Bacteroidota bacterium]
MKNFTMLFLICIATAFFSNHILGQTNGRNVNQVYYDGGRFAENTSGQWIEYAANNNQFKFSETGRDDWSVYMYDASRDISIQLDLYLNKIFIYWDRPERSALYDITKASSKNERMKITKLSKEYKKCASENGIVFFQNKVDVAYGANGKYVFRKGVKGSVKFNNATFGDPIPGVVKSGYFKRIPKKKAAKGKS